MGDESVGAESVFPVFACISFALQSYEKILKLPNFSPTFLIYFRINILGAEKGWGSARKSQLWYKSPNKSGTNDRMKVVQNTE